MSRDFFPRFDYARGMAEQLLRPKALDLGVRSGVFLSNIRRVGKTTFLKRDLIPALTKRGAVVIYVDLWADTTKSATWLVNEAVRTALRNMQAPGSGLARKLKGMSLGALGLTFGFQIDSVGESGGTTLAQAFSELVARTKADVVLIVDEVQRAVSADGLNLMQALKAARDAVNTDPDSPGHFLFVGTGSHRSLVNDMATLPSHPFKGALTATFELLPKAYVQWELERTARDGVPVLPSLEAAWDGFRAMGQRPEELVKALRQFQSAPEPVDAAFRLICTTLASAAADVELARAAELCGRLGEEVFGRIAAGDEKGIKELYGSAALREYSDAVGLDVEASQVQIVVDKLIGANLIARVGHGKFVVSDPFVRQVWRERQAFESAFEAAVQAKKGLK